MEDPADVSTPRSQKPPDEKSWFDRSATPALAASPAARATQLLSGKLSTWGVEERGASCVSGPGLEARSEYATRSGHTANPIRATAAW
jgi:hypothetical protein